MVRGAVSQLLTMSPSNKKVKRENNLNELSDLLKNLLGDHLDRFISNFKNSHLNLRNENGKYQAKIQNQELEIKVRLYLNYL